MNLASINPLWQETARVWVPAPQVLEHELLKRFVSFLNALKDLK